MEIVATFKTLMAFSMGCLTNNGLFYIDHVETTVSLVYRRFRRVLNR